VCSSDLANLLKNYHINRVLKTVPLVILGVLALLCCACGRDESAKEIRELRQQAQMDKARERALAVLTDDPDRTAVWQELVRTDLDISRASRRINETQYQNSLSEAGLICGAIYLHQKRKPSESWKDLATLVSSAMTTECNSLLSALQDQTEMGEYLREMNNNRGGLGGDRAQMVALREVDEYRTQAGSFLKRLAISYTMLDALPELSPGTVKLLRDQLATSLIDWIAALELEPELKETVWNRGTALVRASLSDAQKDLEEMGSLQVDTITRNRLKE
jgi:hypothetical protein